MTILSTHLVVISYDKASGRIEKFLEDCNPSQLTLLIGEKFGNISALVTNYLPTAAIDRITDRKNALLERRSVTENEKSPAENTTDDKEKAED